MATKTNPCWYDTWDEDKKEFCGFCQMRVACLIRTAPDPIYCVRAWHAWQSAVRGIPEC